MKRMAIVGRGTAGALTAAAYSNETLDFEIDWYFDSNVKPQAVGEGANLHLPNLLKYAVNFDHYMLDQIDGSFKASIYKTGWGDGHAFHHTFPPPNISYHFNANKMQDFLQSLVEKKSHVHIYDKNVTHDMIDADYIIDCSGKPSNYDDYHMSEHIPVNSVYVTQCYWNHIQFQYSLTLARPYGWVFGIPLQNRCSIGYLYNKDINTLDEIKEDVKHIFKEYNLEPSDTTNQFNFKNYYRKQNFTDRVSYNGNASFFLEPLEATSIGFMDEIIKWFYLIHDKKLSLDDANYNYQSHIQNIENVIMLHYAAGSKFESEFWRYAKPKGEKALERMANDYHFKEFLQSDINKNTHYGSWPKHSFSQNLSNLNLMPKLDNLLKG